MTSTGLLFLSYGFFILIYVLFSLAGIYHLWRFGYSGDLSKVVIIFYSIVSFLIIMITVLLLSIISSGV